MDRHFAFLLLVVCAGCGGGGGPAGPAVSIPQAAQGAMTQASLTIQLSGASRAPSKTPSFVSAATQSIGIVVNGGAVQVFNVTTNSGGCTTTTTTTCTFTFNAPIGTDTIKITAYDQNGANGNPLSGATINATIAPNTANSLTAQLSPIVWNASDSGAGSLRQAVQDADSGGAITMTGPFTIVLGSPIPILKNLTITGVSGSTIVDGNATSQIFSISAGFTVALQTMTLRNGKASNGGAISNLGNLTISNVTFSNNAATGQGGAIYSGAGSTLTGTANTFTSNSAPYGGGGIYSRATTLTLGSQTFQNNSGGSAGGAVEIYSGTSSIVNSSFSGNTATGGYGGAVSAESTNDATLTTDTFTSNQASYGGAIRNYSAILVDHGTFTSNSCVWYGGAIYAASSTPSQITNSTFTTNSSPSQGGAIYNSYNMLLAGDTFDRNSAQYGGGVYNNQDISVDSSLFSGNTATSGAGGFYDQGNAYNNIVISNSTFTANTSNNYAGAMTVGGRTYSTTITNSTISNNSATNHGGGINSFGALILTGSTVYGNTVSGANGRAGVELYGTSTSTITNSTISRNTAASGPAGGVYASGNLNVLDSTIYGNSAATFGGNISVISGIVVGLRNTIVANGSAATAPDINNAGTVTSGDYNWLQSFTGTAIVSPGANDRSGPLSNIGPLASNGGPTQTHALLAGSPALDQIPVASCAAATDQRGVTRPQGSACDIGAFEK